MGTTQRRVTSRSARSSSWRELAGTAIIVTGLLAAVVGAIIYFSPSRRLQSSFGGWLAVLGIASAMSALGKRWVRFGRKLLAGSAARVLRSDDRAPILFLRAFGDDGQLLNKGGYLTFFTKTFEERLAETLQGVGPVVAIGSPREKLPELGAARMYVDDAHWQRRVQAVMRRAQMVILQVGESEGLVWEVKQALRQLRPEQLILAVPFYTGEQSSADRYFKFRVQTIDLFPQFLPQDLGLATFIYFGPNWEPRILDDVPPLPCTGDPVVKGQWLVLRSLYGRFTSAAVDPRRRSLLASLTAVWSLILSFAWMLGSHWCLPFETTPVAGYWRWLYFVLGFGASFGAWRGDRWGRIMVAGLLGVHLLVLLLAGHGTWGAFSLYALVLDVLGIVAVLRRRASSVAPTPRALMEGGSEGVTFESGLVNIRVQEKPASMGGSLNVQAAIGLLMLSAGLVLTYVFNTGWLWYGAIFFGALTFLTGLIRSV
jgi:hypothetical protein